MKITRVENIFVDEFLFVRITTDEGLTGLGESGSWAFLEASAAAVDTFARYLVGQDPLRIEHHNQYMQRCYHFRGAAIMGAVSAIDIALWDIAGKYYDVPVYQLLGGRCRDKARVYYHVFGETTRELVEGCIAAKNRGFTAIGHLTPFLDTPRGQSYPAEAYAQKIEESIDRVRQFREAVGWDTDLCIEIHRRLKPQDAIVLARGIAPYHPYFYEDPTLPENLDSMAYVAQRIELPVATGERLNNLQEFAMLLQRRAAQYLRPDVCMCGGITATKKIAAMAEGFDVDIIPHNPLSPVSTAACLQVALSIPNFAIQEYPKGEGESPRSEILINHVSLENGYLKAPDIAGIGIELADGAEKRFPYKPRRFAACLHADGSMADR